MTGRWSQDLNTTGLSGWKLGGNSTVREAVVLREPRLLFAVQAYLPVSPRLGLLTLNTQRGLDFNSQEPGILTRISGYQVNSRI